MQKENSGRNKNTANETAVQPGRAGRDRDETIRPSLEPGLAGADDEEWSRDRIGNGAAPTRTDAPNAEKGVLLADGVGELYFEHCGLC